MLRGTASSPSLRAGCCYTAPDNVVFADPEASELEYETDNLYKSDDIRGKDDRSMPVNVCIFDKSHKRDYFGT